MLITDEPKIKDQSPGSWGRLAEYASLPFMESLHAFTFQRKELLDALQKLNLEDWSRSAWLDGCKHTVFSQARRMAMHEQIHLQQFEEIAAKYK